MELIKRGYGSYSQFPYLRVTFATEEQFEMLVELGFSLGIDSVGTSKRIDFCCSEDGHEAKLITALKKCGVAVKI